MPDYLRQKLSSIPPFSLLSSESLELWLTNSRIYSYEPGERIVRPDEFQNRIYLLLAGRVRLIGMLPDLDGQISLSVCDPGYLFGWISLLRSKPCEFIQASTNAEVLSLDAKIFIELLKNNNSFSQHFDNLSNIHESLDVAISVSRSQSKRTLNWQHSIVKHAINSKAFSFNHDLNLKDLPVLASGYNWYLSTPGIENYPVGSPLVIGDTTLPDRKDLLTKYRAVSLPIPLPFPNNTGVFTDELQTTSTESIPATSIDLQELGILEEDHLPDEQRFPVIRAKGTKEEIIAIVQIISLTLNVPFRRDIIQKLVAEHINRDKGLSLEFIASLFEVLSINTQLAQVRTEHIDSIEAPAVFILNGIPVVYNGIRGGQIVIAHPHHGIVYTTIADIHKNLGDLVQFILPRRGESTVTSKFGWSWFIPLLKKYKKSLFLVFFASLLAQLFGLAIPLLLQQIIDKVLSQGNISSLNVLGATMIILALFQGILQSLRTYIFVDTTDRMDLTLGSSVVDKLLSLPLSFFERRPVGELSQRLGELNSIRSFLTGTALISILNIIFATVYLIVMFIYSPFLSCVALSMFPLYLLMVFVVSPIYKNFIRKRAIAQASTQSHLIEIIGGIQTVKAQHFELNARWKWQDRYRKYVSEGFKSSALGSTAGEFGNFLNQVSGLLVLWIGMKMVLDGDFTLGQLIAFRIISGNVTGPLLQLAGLYQGFQSVQLSMERLSDIIDQTPEFQNAETPSQIALPPVTGNIRFENLSFRFGKNGSYQIQNVDLSVEAGSFVGIVGQSGSGKSTLMKLLPRLYTPNSGSIYIDDYDISKVDLSSLRRQIGIVPQDSLLFEGTVSENIALNDPNATENEIINAAKISCAHDFIMSLPSGYATQLSEKGSNLSGGQRQRIAIARTILSKPQILVMDEATSALDYVTEQQLCNNIHKYTKGRTVFFVTHRLSTIRNSDIIVVMHQGRISESGNHDQLMKLNGRYATIYLQQDAEQ